MKCVRCIKKLWTRKATIEGIVAASPEAAGVKDGNSLCAACLSRAVEKDYYND